MYVILSAAIEPATRTRLMYAKASSYSVLRQHTKLVLEHRMLEVHQIVFALKPLVHRYLGFT
jgi:hypothetical protein